MRALVEDQDEKPKKLREGLREYEAIPKLAEYEVGRNNTEGVECCKVFRSCTIRQVLKCSLRKS